MPGKYRPKTDSRLQKCTGKNSPILQSVMAALNSVERINKKTQEVNKAKVVWHLLPQPKCTCWNDASFDFGQAPNAEQQERIFNHIKRITGSTSNYHPEQIIPNVFVCLQAEKEMHLHADDASQQQAEICQLAEVLPPNTNTSIPLRLIRRYPIDGKLLYNASVISSLKERVFGGEDMKTKLCSMTLRTAQVLITMALNYEKHNLKVPTYEIMKNDEEASVLLKKLKNAKALLKEWNINF